MTKTKAALRILMGVFYVGAGLNHLRDPDFYLGLMPPYIPLQLPVVYMSGILEIVLGLLATLPRTSSPASWGVVVMLVAFLPVHVHMLVNNHLYPEVPTSLLWLRFPLQGLLILWAYWFTDPIRDTTES